MVIANEKNNIRDTGYYLFVSKYGTSNGQEHISVRLGATYLARPVAFHSCRNATVRCILQVDISVLPSTISPAQPCSTPNKRRPARTGTKTRHLAFETQTCTLHCSRRKLLGIRRAACLTCVRTGPSLATGSVYQRP